MSAAGDRIRARQGTAVAWEKITGTPETRSRAGWTITWRRTPRRRKTRGQGESWLRICAVDDRFGVSLPPGVGSSQESVKPQANVVHHSLISLTRRFILLFNFSGIKDGGGTGGECDLGGRKCMPSFLLPPLASPYRCLLYTSDAADE